MILVPNQQLNSVKLICNTSIWILTAEEVNLKNAGATQEDYVFFTWIHAGGDSGMSDENPTIDMSFYYSKFYW